MRKRDALIAALVVVTILGTAWWHALASPLNGDADSGPLTPLRKVELVGRHLDSPVFSPTADEVLSGKVIYSLQDGRPLRFLDSPGDINAAHYSEDGKTLYAFTSDGRMTALVTAFDTASCKVKRQYKSTIGPEYYIEEGTIATHGSDLLAACGPNGGLVVYDPRDGTQLREHSIFHAA